MFQTVPIEQSNGALGTVADIFTITTSIITIGVLIVAAILLAGPRVQGYWLRRKKRWPVIVSMTSLIGHWAAGQRVTAYYRIKPRWRTWSRRNYPRVIKAMLIGEFAGSRDPEKLRTASFTDLIFVKHYPQNDTGPVENLTRFEITGEINDAQAKKELLSAYVVVIVKYPPHDDFDFETSRTKLVRQNVGPDVDGYGRRFR